LVASLELSPHNRLITSTKGIATSNGLLVINSRIVGYRNLVVRGMISDGPNSHRMAKKKTTIPPKLTETEVDLLAHMSRGYELETDALGGNPVLRSVKDDTVMRPADANASTVKALEQCGLIRPGKSRDPLTIAWRLNSA
jgi:hypothetical protein